MFWTTALAVAAVIAVAGVYAFKAPDRLIGKLSLIVVGLLGHAIVFGLYLLLTLIQVSSPVLTDGRGDGTSALADLQSGHVTPALAADLAAMGFSVSEGQAIQQAGSGTYTRWLIRSADKDFIVTRWKGTLRVVNMLSWDGSADTAFLIVGVIGLLFAVVFSNPNVTAAHGFFRDRMSRAFLFTDKDGAVDHCDGLKLSQLNGPGSAAPYHLLNATLNLQGARNLDLAGRDADFFVLASRYSGSPTTGYCRTTELEKRDPHLNLGTAMAISGAGLSPNQGTETVKSLVYLTALLNLRLDYWLANPRRVGSASAFRRLRLSAAVGPIYLLKEALGLLDGQRHVRQRLGRRPAREPRRLRAAAAALPLDRRRRRERRSADVVSGADGPDSLRADRPRHHHRHRRRAAAADRRPRPRSPPGMSPWARSTTATTSAAT